MVTASIVSYKTAPEEIVNLVGCVAGSDVSTVYVVDNASDDALRIALEGVDKVEYIPSANKGYGHGHNIAIRKSIAAGADYHAVINPDIYFGAGVLDKLAGYMDANPDVGLVMPDVVYPDGSKQYLCKLLPTPADLFVRRYINNRVTRKSRERFEMRFSGLDKEMDVPYLSGCFMFLRNAALKETGLFDERFFMYCEDIDLSRRIHIKYRTVFWPEVRVVHVHEAGSRRSFKLLRAHIGSVFKYFNKWGWFFDRQRRRVNKAAIKAACGKE